MSYSEQIARDLKAIEAEVPNTCTVAGQVYPCLLSSCEDDNLLTVGGLESEVVFACLVRLAHFTNPAGVVTLPAVGSRVRVRDTDYRLVSLRRDHVGVAVRLHLADISTARK